MFLLQTVFDFYFWISSLMLPIFLIIFGIGFFVCLYFSIKYWKKYSTKSNVEGKVVYCRDFKGNKLELGFFHSFGVFKNYPTIKVFANGTKSSDYRLLNYILICHENKYNESLIDYGDELWFLTNFEKSNLQKGIIVSLMSVEAIEIGLTQSLKDIENKVIPLRDKIEFYKERNELLEKEALITFKNNIIEQQMVIYDLQYSFLPVLRAQKKEIMKAPSMLQFEVTKEDLEEKMQLLESFLQELPSEVYKKANDDEPKPKYKDYIDKEIKTVENLLFPAEKIPKKEKNPKKTVEKITVTKKEEGNEQDESNGNNA